MHAVVLVRTRPTLELHEVVLAAGLLGDAVDGPAGRAAAGERRTRPLGDFDLLQGETLADGHARVAQAVHEHVAAGFVAADDVAVAERVAALAGAQGDARLGGEDLAQVRLAGILYLRLGQHAHGRRRVGGLLEAPRVARNARLVRHAGLGIGVGVDRTVLDPDRIQLDLLFVRGFLGRGRTREHHRGNTQRDRVAGHRGRGRPPRSRSLPFLRHPLLHLLHSVSFLVVGVGGHSVISEYSTGTARCRRSCGMESGMGGRGAARSRSGSPEMV